MKKRRYPFTFLTQTSINLADDEYLMQLMTRANFNQVFIGIESPSKESLAECGKTQNETRDLTAAIKTLQDRGLEVQGGFIVGFDHDPQAIFQDIINFVQGSGVVTAMVGLLHAPNGTRLYKRLKSENRLTGNFSGNNTDLAINFVPKMNMKTLMDGYKRIVDTLYAPKQYYERVITFLKQYKRKSPRAGRLKPQHYMALFKSFWILGVTESGRRHFWKLVFWTMFRRPRAFPMSITLAIYGFHFRQVAHRYASPMNLAGA
jgi:radical SAM superfamily enzyme YgiQ (UPF0313 family)